MFIAGIDGGGTHTRLEIRDENNRNARRTEFGPFNLNSIGEDAFRHLLREVFSACGDMRECAGLCIGGAGISNPAVGSILREELAKADFHGKWKLCGDQEIALRGAMDEPGIALIAGTGSICFGRNHRGETARSGGFGHLIDDGGSGYALGRDVFSAAVRAADGRGDDEAILRAVYARLGGSGTEAIVSFVYGRETDKASIARFSEIALTLAEKEDDGALRILRRGAEELHGMVSAVKFRLKLSHCPIALMGGLLREENIYRHMVKERLSPLGDVIYPAHDPLWGAAQMAWEL